MTGAKAVFVDDESEVGNIDISTVEEATSFKVIFEEEYILS